MKNYLLPVMRKLQNPVVCPAFEEKSDVVHRIDRYIP